MFKMFYPDRWVNSAYDIDYEELFRTGIRGLIFDIDNTLVPHGAHADKRAVELFERLHRIGLKAVLLSNNKEPRVRSFCEEVKYCSYIYKAGKPQKSPQNTDEFGEDRCCPSRYFAPKPAVLCNLI